jgi:hypothetical protein
MSDHDSSTPNEPKVGHYTSKTKCIRDIVVGHGAMTVPHYPVSLIYHFKSL